MTPLISYKHPLRIAWNLLMLGAILSFLLIITYRIVFQNFVADALYYALQSLFFLDIVANFMTRVKSGYARLDRWTEIAGRYLHGSFVVDLIAAIPLEPILLAIFASIPQNSMFSHAYLPLQALTLIKLLKTGRIFDELEEALNLLPAVRRLVLFGYWLAAVLHLIAVGWILIGASELARVPKDRYLRALYWVTTTISTIGYGDYTPDHNSNAQISYTIVIQLFGVAMFSYVIANVSSLVSNLDVARSAYRRRLDEVNAYLRAQRIPLDLQERVRDYYAYLWEKQRGISAMSVLDEFPRSLSQEILMFLNREVLDNVELFRGADELFIRESVQLLRPRVFLPGEYIIREGEYGDCMYFLTGGEVRVLVKGNEVARLGPGSPFGETALVENLHRNASIVSISYSVGYRLAKDDFDKLRARYPEFDKQVKAVVAKRRVKA